ncbi:hypothetical protein K493DRAFT_333549 [Basidiobolus meristosporus CBS 931.73]|uniref:Uncharacterized protein n=1 Tax=Basidiobolus meristosporus CBS 931.73 TaxID=1314790 RepID=A0A1Y1Z639_9FUNG|nr:hypothetical protein K493DRAFT_333549 [Basidiobolus meristosporus CBS 931.73]|eukprot:ORY05457.1 hypothetical protein K493DRAFT_333549 [Basidiobolus meristosporus CBS 931.73]
MSSELPQQQIISLLSKLDSLCRQWSTQQAFTSSLFSSLINLLTQRDETLSMLSKQQETGSNRNLRVLKNPSLLPYNVLESLVYKQSVELEKILSQLHQSINGFEKSAKSMAQLKNSLNKMLSSIPSNGLEKITQSKQDQNVAAITLLEVANWIVSVEGMYSKELQVKIHIIRTLDIRQLREVEDVAIRWNSQAHIRFDVEEEFSERLKICKIIEEYISLE